jgi:microcystin-dependent protein
VFGEAQARALSAGYASAEPSVPMAPAVVGIAGGGQPHNNMPPHLALNFCIALNGEIVPP